MPPQQSVPRLAPTKMAIHWAGRRLNDPAAVAGSFLFHPCVPDCGAGGSVYLHRLWKRR